MNFTDKHIVILGTGVSGLGALQLAISKNLKVSISEHGKINDSTLKIIKKYNIPYEEQGHTKGFIDKADIIIKSPGISSQIDILRDKDKKIIIDEIEFSYKYNKSANIAITGTNGKTSTTSLIFHILKDHFKSPIMAGNIGTSVSKSFVDYIPDLLVVELSSFQIEGIKEYKPYVSIYTNITADHLDRYQGSFDAYAMAKWRLTQNLDSSCMLILNIDDKKISSLLDTLPSKATTIPFSLHESVKSNYNNYAFCNNETIEINLFGRQEYIHLGELPFNGKHQKMNIMAALLASIVLKPKIPTSDLIERLKCFPSIPHRMEPCGIINRRLFVNDSKATNVEASIYALDSYENPITWIAGGYDKGNDYNQIISLAKKKVQNMICLGLDNSKLKSSFKDIPTFEVKNMKFAVQKAYQLAEENSTILLSPMCASFDLFSNYIERGNIFKKNVQLLKSEKLHA